MKKFFCLYAVILIIAGFEKYDNIYLNIKVISRQDSIAVENVEVKVAKGKMQVAGIII